MDLRCIGTAPELASLMTGCRYQSSRIHIFMVPQLCLISGQLVQINSRIDLVLHRYQMASATARVARIYPYVDPAAGHGLLRLEENVVHFMAKEMFNECVSERAIDL